MKKVLKIIGLVIGHSLSIVGKGLVILGTGMQTVAAKVLKHTETELSS